MVIAISGLVLSAIAIVVAVCGLREAKRARKSAEVSQRVAESAHHLAATPQLKLMAGEGVGWFSNLRLTSNVDLDSIEIALLRDNSNPEETAFSRLGPLFMHSFDATPAATQVVRGVRAGLPYPFRVERTKVPTTTGGQVRIRCTCRQGGSEWVTSRWVRRDWL